MDTDREWSWQNATGCSAPAEASRLLLEQGTRIAALEQHISELEKALEGARKERDEGIAAARANIDGTRVRAEAAERQRDDAQAELARLKPSGQVAEDVTALRQLVVGVREAHYPPTDDHDTPGCGCLQCLARIAPSLLSRLAAQAQAYETERLQWQETGILLDSRRKAAEEVARQRTEERDTAVAANAARQRIGAMMANACFNLAQRDHLRPDERQTLDELRRAWDASGPHPGAAMLEEHQALKRLVVALAHEMERTINHRDQAGGLRVPDHGDFSSAPPSMLGRLRWWARELRGAIKEAEQ